jgi:hypothetical protein
VGRLFEGLCQYSSRLFHLRDKWKNINPQPKPHIFSKYAQHMVIGGRKFRGRAPRSRGNMYPSILAADLHFHKLDPYFQHQILILGFEKQLR